MAYLVKLTARTGRDFAALFRQINAADSIPAARWFNGIEKAIGTSLPLRCPTVPERKKKRKPLRHMLYGKKPNVYRVIFDVDETQGIVSVLTIRHGAMDTFKELEQ
jgi:toxin ParE1/3/4